jgi:DNA helicase-2/ATP-dependent DNA helicase PcrA
MANFSAAEIYRVIADHALTEEQAAMVEADVSKHNLVIAGAGSGKTQMMMTRVLYLVANGFARPEQILGLTFTRKAASEFSARVQQGLVRLRETALWPAELEDDFLPAKISTYNSFGNELFRTQALKLGYDPEAQVITDSLAIDLVTLALHLEHENPDSAVHLADIGKAELIKRAMHLATQLSDHLIENELEDEIAAFRSHLSLLPKNEKGGEGVLGYTQEHLDRANKLSAVAAIANRYRQLKRERGLVDYSDQIRLALAALDEGSLSHDFRFVLLDEYQDTSRNQAELLSRLFGGRTVMAVGDPNQAIYGWRGASSDALAQFAENFGEAASLQLSTSWRSGAEVVAVANLIAASGSSDSVQVKPLTSGLSASSKVYALQLENQSQEASEVASWLKERFSPTSSQAILFRTKKSMMTYAVELERQGLPYEVTGLSSLVEQPEVADLISILKVLGDPSAGAEAIRLLTGPRFRLAPDDIAALALVAKKLSRVRSEVTADKPVTIVELIDEISASSKPFEELSAEAWRRIAEFGEILRGLRRLGALSLGELCWMAIREFELDIELYTHSRSPEPLANLHAFVSKVSAYEAAVGRSDLASFIAWLEVAIELEDFELPKQGGKRGLVQLMTIHAAKGLEWDFVVVPNLATGSFPGKSKESLGWLSGQSLPSNLRLDKASLPELQWAKASSQRDFDSNILPSFKARLAEHQLGEERRLAYVAFTRAAKELLVTCSSDKPGAKTSAEPSEFFLEIAGSEKVTKLRPNSDSTAEESAVYWPRDPLGESRSSWEKAAQVVAQSAPGALSEADQLALLLADREKPSFSEPVDLPRRLSASAIVKLLADPEQFAKDIARPVPSSYTASADLGSRFHASLEDAFLAGAELDISGWEQEEKELGISFQSSRFATMQPLFVERQIEFVLGGTIVVCKLDAVFSSESGYEIVDWKSGKTPSQKDLAARAIQLALYRIGLSRAEGVPIEQIAASFFYAADGNEVRPDLTSEAELASRLESLRTARR